jgi:hypothetical protein
MPARSGRDRPAVLQGHEELEMVVTSSGSRRRRLTILLGVLIAGGGSPATFAATAAKPVLALEHLSTITEHAWAWGSEAKPFLDGSRLYVPLGFRGLAIYDLGDPRSPRLLKVVGRKILGGQGGAVAASGDRAYVALPVEGAVAVLDVSRPSAPRRLARFGDIPDIRQVALRGRHLFVNAGSSTDYVGGVHVFDVSVTPPAPVGEYLTDLVDPGFHVSASGVVFLARTPATAEDMPKVDVVDMSLPGSPPLLDRWRSTHPGNIVDIDLRQKRLYCSAYWGGLWVLDAADPSDLSLIARFDSADPAATAVGVQGAPPYAFLARGGPEVSDWRFQAFQLARGSLPLRREIAATLPPHSIYRSGNLLVLVELEGPYVLNPRKILRLFQIWR